MSIGPEMARSGESLRRCVRVKIEYPITFLYYKDLPAVVPFYADLLGLP